MWNFLRCSIQLIITTLLVSTALAANNKDKPQGAKKMSNPVVIIETNKGTMEAELWEDKTPNTVKNFLAYAEEKFFDNTIFHRVIPNFMIQGGGFTVDMKQKQTKAAIKNEATRELKNDRGTLAMARTMDIHSATSQFFINHIDNPFLNQQGTNSHDYGYCVFGKLTKGLEVLDAIAKVQTGSSGPHENVPKEPVTILSIRKK